MRKKLRTPRQTRFTLVELLVVIAILLILISLLQPALKSALKTGRQIVCMNTQKLFGAANATYVDDFAGTNIPAWYWKPGGDKNDQSDRTAWFGNKSLWAYMQVKVLPGPEGNSGYYWEDKWMCPDSRSANTTPAKPGFPLIMYSYAFNSKRLRIHQNGSGGYTWGNKPGPDGEDAIYLVSQVKRPSETCFMGESINPPGIYRSQRTYWPDYLKSGVIGDVGNMAYPHDWSVNTLFFDGSVKSIFFEEIADTDNSIFWRPDY